VFIRNAILNIRTLEVAPTSKSTLGELSFTDRSSRVIEALHMTFAHMKHSNTAVYNVDILTDLLGLDTGEQQDLHELSNLLIAKLDSPQSAQLGKKDPSLPSISQLMNGRQEFSVTCRKCNHVSSRQETFCELDLAVEGQKSISESLEHYFQEELLDGDNKYECSTCNSRQEAIRKTEIVATPPVLFVQLRRNVYDMKTFQKIKLKSSIQYPSMLTLLNDTYQLTAVVFHRGASAYGGHYITEVLNWEDDKWWLCDDSTVLFSPNGPCKLQKDKVTATSPSSTQEEEEKEDGVEVADLTQDDSSDERERCTTIEEEEVDVKAKTNSRTGKGGSRGRGKAARDSLRSLDAVNTPGSSEKKSTRKRTTKVAADSKDTPAVVIDINKEKDSIQGSSKKKQKQKQKQENKEEGDSALQGKAIQDYEMSNKLNRSKDAYMLVYVKQDILPTTSSPTAPQPPLDLPLHSAEVATAVVESGSGLHQNLLNTSPDFLWNPNQVTAVLQENDIFSVSFDKYMARATGIEQQITQRKAEYSSFEKLCSSETMEDCGAGSDDMYDLVPTVWLRSWVTGQEVSSSMPTSSLPVVSATVCDLTDTDDVTTAVASVSAPECIDISGDSKEEEWGKQEKVLEAVMDPDNESAVFSKSIRNLPFVCPHSLAYHSPEDDSGVRDGNHIHPAVIADHFKLIPRAAFQLIAESIRSSGAAEGAGVVDHPFTNYNVKCDLCCSSELSKKDDLKDTYDNHLMLLQLLNSGGSGGGGDEKLLLPGQKDVQGRYVVEKKWITWLKKKVDSLQKEISGRKQQQQKKNKKSIAQLFLPKEDSAESVLPVNKQVIALDDDETDHGTDYKGVAAKTDDAEAASDPASVGVPLKDEDISPPSVSLTPDDEEEEEEEGGMPLNQSLVCPHDCLVPNYHRRVKYISHTAWVALQELFPASVLVFVAASSADDSDEDGGSGRKERNWKKKRKRSTDQVKGRSDKSEESVATSPKLPAASSYSSAFPKGRSECLQCIQESSLQKEILQSHQQVRKEERTGEYRCLRDLARRVACFSAAPLDESLCYYVVDGFWLQQWRAFTLDTHGEVNRPDVLTNASLLCTHGGINIPKMLHDKLQSSAKHEQSVEASSYNLSRTTEVLLKEEAPLCELVTEQQWLALGSLGYHSRHSSDCQEDAGGDRDASVVSGADDAHTFPVVVVRASCSVIHVDVSPATTTACTRRSAAAVPPLQATWGWEREQCEVCAALILQERTRCRTYFHNQDIQLIELASLEELPRNTPSSSTPDGSTAVFGTPVDARSTIASRRSTRTCRSSSSKRTRQKSVSVSSQDVLAMLILKIFELWPHARPLEQRIYTEAGVLLEGHHRTLEALGVLAGCTLYVLVVSGDATVTPQKRRGKRTGSSRKKSRRGNSSAEEEEEGEEGTPEAAGRDTDDGVTEMWQIVSLHSSGGYDHVSGSAGGGGGGGDDGVDDGVGVGVTDLTFSSEKSESKKKKQVCEDGFSGTFLMG
jgi:hypothetical protein